MHRIDVAQKAVGNQKSATSREVTDLDRQKAFFDFEMLMYLVLHAPSPVHDAAIKLAEFDNRLVGNDLIQPKLDEVEATRQFVHRRLREQHGVVALTWSDQTLKLAAGQSPLVLTSGVPRHVLLEVTNTTSNSVDLSAQQASYPNAANTKYTIHAASSQLMPVELLIDDVTDKVQLQIHSAGDAPLTRELELPIVALKCATIRGKLRDQDRAETWPGRVFVLGSDGEYRHGKAFAGNETLSRKQLLQFTTTGRYYKLPFFYSDGSFEVQVPPGRTRLKLERGFEHGVVESEVDLKPGEVRELELESGRLVDMAKRGWISGDTHVHWVTNQWNVDLPLDLLATVQRAEDLRVANNLTLLQRGPSMAFINPQQAPMGPVAEYSNQEYHIEMGEEYRNEDLYGHLCFLNISWLVQPIGTGSIIAGPDALDYPLNKTAILACREQGGISVEAHGLGGNKDVPVNVVHELTDSLDQINPDDYYDFLDCGFRLPLTNGSDHPARVVGCARAYVHVDGDFTYDKWIDGIRKCRTFTTSGPLLFLTVNEANIGDVIDVGAEHELKIHAEVISRYPVGHFQLISNGKVLKEIRVDDAHAEIDLTIPAGESRWIVARCSPTDNYNAIWQAGVAHTSAIYVNVDSRPRFVADKAKLWIGRMRQHIRDIRAKGRFANDQQLQEAVGYVEEGIDRYERMIANDGAQRLANSEIPNGQVEYASQLPSKSESEVAVTSQAVEDFPQVEAVESQPLLVQVNRLAEALEYIGAPLSPEVLADIKALKREPQSNQVARRVQELLDPLCVAAVEIDDNQLRAFASPGEHELDEQGWRSYLVKVCNRAGVTSRLQVESPNARSMPHAKQKDLASRWLGLAMFDGRPMQASLSGLELEYRIVQFYSRDAGQRQATLEFNVDPKPGKTGRQIREWRFDEGTDGWKAANQSDVAVRDGSLVVKGLGDDPFITAEVGGATGELVLRFWAETEQDGVGQLFWWTEERPAPDSERVATFPLLPGGPQQYELPISVDGVLAGIRIDPNGKRCEMRIDWIDLSYLHRRGETWDSVPLTFQAKPSVPVTLHVTDPSGVPAAAALVIRDKLQRIYPAQSKRLAPDLFFHPQIYRRDGETLRLPRGEYEVRLWRGPHSIPETQQIVIADVPKTLEYTVRRWIDPTKHGWWSGDHHIHAAGCLHYIEPTQGVTPEDMLRQIMGEDLNVGCCLTWGPCFDYQKQFFSAKVDNISEYPYLLRYDVEVSGFGSHASGHLNLLRLQQQIYPGGESKDHWPTLGTNTLRWAKGQGAICGTAHSGNGLTRYIDRLDYPDGPHGLPHFNIPAFDGIGAMEYVMNVTHEIAGPDGKPVPAIDFIATMNTPRCDEWNMWYHTLNCGFRVRASGETDFPCMSGERVGIGRVYVNTGPKLDFERWVTGLRDGRSYVSDGKVHLMDFQARPKGESWLAVGDQNSEIQLAQHGAVEFRAKVAALLEESPTVEVELIVNGYPVEKKSLPADGTLHDLQFESVLPRSSWVALRVFPNAHSNPFFVIIDGQPIRSAKASAEWCLRGLEQCWFEKERTYAPAELEQAKTDYEHARQAYRRILAECEK